MGKIFNITIVGDGRVGKTAFIKKCTANQFEPRYLPSDIGYSEQLVTHEYKVNLCEYGNHIKYNEKQEFNLETDYALILYSSNDVLSLKNVPNWYARLRHQLGTSLPIVAVATKQDIQVGILTQTKTDQINSLIAEYKTKYSIEFTPLPISNRVGNQPLGIVKALVKAIEIQHGK